MIFSYKSLDPDEPKGLVRQSEIIVAIGHSKLETGQEILVFQYTSGTHLVLTATDAILSDSEGTDIEIHMEEIHILD